MRFKRPPTPLIILCIGFVLFSIYALSGVLAGLRLPQLSLPFPNGYLVFRNLVWGVGVFIVVISLVVADPRSVRLAWGIVTTVILWYWIDRLLFASSDFSRQSWPISLIIQIAIVLWIIWTFDRPTVRRFLLEKQNE